MSCRSGCLTQDHDSWGECARAANFQVGDLTGTGELKTTDRRLNAYAKAKGFGLQPESTKLAESERTLRDAGAYVR